MNLPMCCGESMKIVMEDPLGRIYCCLYFKDHQIVVPFDNRPAPEFLHKPEEGEAKDAA